MSSVFKTTKIIAAVLCLLATASGARAQATARQPGTAPAVRYPIVFKQAERVRALGLSVESGDRALKNKCYAYGEGSYSLSVSDERLAAAKAKGFSLESLCMGLVSEARFNPETGKRLPTYIYFDATGLRAELSTIRDDDPPAIRKYKGRDPATFSAKELQECCDQIPGFIWEELPLALPGCFKNGTPYADCTWRFGLKSGKRLSDASVKKFRDLGRSIDAALRRAIAEKPACSDPIKGSWWPCTPAIARHESGELYPEGYGLREFINNHMVTFFPGHRPLPAAAHKGSDMTFFDVSASFPRGYGYALYADGSAGPGISNASVRAAAEGDGPGSQIDVDRLRQLVEDDE